MQWYEYLIIGILTGFIAGCITTLIIIYTGVKE
jgi:gas vesicle protein